jgi:hypothetical protein
MPTYEAVIRFTMELEASSIDEACEKFDEEYGEMNVERVYEVMP